MPDHDPYRNPAALVLPRALQEAARAKPKHVWLRCSDGGSLTFAQAVADAEKVAGYLYALGVRPGDHVVLMMINSTAFVQAWAGIGRLGAVAVLLNTEINGVFLEHQLNNCQAKVAIVGEAQCAAVLDVCARTPDLSRMLVPSDLSATLRAPADRAEPLTITAWDDWQQAQAYTGALPDYRDIAAIMYTSGTTGPSKGVLMTHLHCAMYGVRTKKSLQMQEDDVYYITLPLYHANGLLLQLGLTILAQISAYLRTRFSAAAWVQDVYEQNITLTNMLGTTGAFTLAQPPSELDGKLKLRAISAAPNPPEHEHAFRTRFGVKDVLSGFGMTELGGSPARGIAGHPVPAGASGWVDTDQYDAIVADPETDLPVPEGTPGELLLRPKIPFAMTMGYYRMPEKTVAAWRNGWFHTGDAVTIKDGALTYIDRMDDCIRRRGQQISPTEIEIALVTLPDVAEVAAYGIRSDTHDTEMEIALAIVLTPGATISAQTLGDKAEALLPRFAKPRYIRIVDAIPKTQTAKVQRARLRAQGVADAYDRG